MFFLILFYRYEKSAIIYADTHSSFEEISLKFLQESQIEALKTFLKKVGNWMIRSSGSTSLINWLVCFCTQKLEGLKPQDKTQVTMIVIWVVELFMNQMGALRSDHNSLHHNPDYQKLQKQFDSFLAIPKVDVRSVRYKKYVSSVESIDFFPPFFTGVHKNAQEIDIRPDAESRGQGQLDSLNDNASQLRRSYKATSLQK